MADAGDDDDDDDVGSSNVFLFSRSGNAADADDAADDADGNDDYGLCFSSSRSTPPYAPHGYTQHGG